MWIIESKQEDALSEEQALVFRLRQVISHTLEKKTTLPKQSIQTDIQSEIPAKLLKNEENSHRCTIEPIPIDNSRIGRFAVGAKYFRERSRLRMPIGIRFTDEHIDNIVEILYCRHGSSHANIKETYDGTTYDRNTNNIIVKNVQEDDDDSGNNNRMIPSASVIFLVAVVPVLSLVLIVAVMVISFFTGNNPHMRKMVQFFSSYKPDPPPSAMIPMFTEVKLPEYHPMNQSQTQTIYNGQYSSVPSGYYVSQTAPIRQ